ncbi:hypothetical protein ANN_24015 [Periplaneta americana]|uniref:Uncharacterized protein n=1 Tax=Periplaneta americana TaxID=6978 RepID=A0ABQ8S281_PERAM|nr:hypothetical protein ANN_24015 [Periplaneta americana]
MSPESNTESYPAFARIGLRENPGKNLNQVTCPDRDSNPGDLVSWPDAVTVIPQGIPKPGTATVKEDEYEDVRWEGMDNIEECCDRVSRLWRPNLRSALQLSHGQERRPEMSKRQPGGIG